MKNKEKFADKIIDFACSEDSIAVDSKGEVVSCASMVSCENCMFGEEKECKTAIKDWLEREYVELFVISRKDVRLLEYVKDDYKYIARNENGDLYLHINKPKRGSRYWVSVPSMKDVNIKPFNVDFPMIKWEDSEPWLVEDLMNLKVVSEYE